jgi:surface antigen
MYRCASHRSFATIFATASASLTAALRQIAAPAFVALACVSTAHAQNLGFMHDSPISFMKQKDIASLTEALNAALDKGTEGQTSEWSNKGLGNGVPITATITPKDALQDKAMSCRHVAIQLMARNQQQSWQPLYCKTPGGWKLQKR